MGRISLDTPVTGEDLVPSSGVKAKGSHEPNSFSVFRRPKKHPSKDKFFSQKKTQILKPRLLPLSTAPSHPIFPT